MSEAYKGSSAAARSLESELLRRIGRVKNATIGEAIGKDESTVSRIASGEIGVKLDVLGDFLAVLGLRVVDKSATMIDGDVLRAYKTLASRHLTAGDAESGE